LNFENTDKIEEIEAVKLLQKNEFKVDKNLMNKSDKFTPIHYKAAFIILKNFRELKERRSTLNSKAFSSKDGSK
jgi:hypothetical protein